MNGISFDTMSGIDLTGWWYDHRTGNNINVVDQFFEDNNLYVKTADNRIIPYAKIENYIKTESPIRKQETQPVKKSNPIPKEILDELDDFSDDEPQDFTEVTMFEDDIEMLKGNARSTNDTSSRWATPRPQLVLPTNNEPVNPNKHIIEKAFSKIDDMMFDFTILWEGHTELINMLTNVMDISEEEIIDFLTDKYFNKTKYTFKEKLREFLFNDVKLNAEEE